MYAVQTLATHASPSGKHFVVAKATTEDAAFAAIGIPGKLITVSAYAEFADAAAAQAALPLMQAQLTRLRIKCEVGENLGNLAIA